MSLRTRTLHVMLRRSVKDWHGRDHALSIGVVGFLPPQTPEWDSDLSDQMHCEDILEAARRVVQPGEERFAWDGRLERAAGFAALEYVEHGCGIAYRP